MEKYDNAMTKIVDVVIPWCGNDFDQKIHTTEEDLLRQLNNNELFFCLDSIKVFAKWINKIYIVSNEVSVPSWIPEPNKTIFIDRTKLLGGKKTTNGLVAETLSWKIPELSEYFILAHDDIILGHNTTIDDFFYEDKSIYSNYLPKWGPFTNKTNHRLYYDSSVFNNKTPLSCGPYPHKYIGMKKSICEKIENEYNNWFSFMRSHLDSRYSSFYKDYSMEEDFKGVYVWYTRLNNYSVYREQTSYVFGFINYNENCYDTRLSSDKNKYIPCNKSILNFKNHVIKHGECPLFINFNSIENIKDISNIWNFIKIQ